MENGVIFQVSSDWEQRESPPVPAEVYNFVTGAGTIDVGSQTYAPSDLPDPYELYAMTIAVQGDSADLEEQAPVESMVDGVKFIVFEFSYSFPDWGDFRVKYLVFLLEDSLVQITYSSEKDEFTPAIFDAVIDSVRLP
jgi:hypothetical protein